MPPRKARRLQILVAVLTAAAGTLTGAPPAGAYLKDFHAELEVTPSDSRPIKGGEFECQAPRGTEIGAGISVPPLSNLGISSLLAGGDVLDRAQETDSEPAPWAMTVRMWCALYTTTKPNVGGAASYVKRVVIARNQSSSNSNAFKSVQATCPSDSATAIGGGGNVDGATNEVTLESVQRLQQGRVLRVKAHETDATGASWAVEAHAICADTTSAPNANIYAEVVSPFVVHNLTTSSLDKTLTASCPAGKVAIGGGAKVFTPLNPGALPPPVDVVLEQSRPAGDGATATGWIATAVEVDPAAGPWTLLVKAVCAKPDGTFA